MTADAPRGVGRALLGALLLSLAMPPARIPGGEWLALPGLALCYSFLTDSRRPYRLAALFGFVHLMWLSWSVRFVSGGGYVVIGISGAITWWIGAIWLRRGRRWLPGPLAFGVAVAAANWFRAHAYDLAYPHGQPAHVFYEWLGFIQPVRIVGEVGMNVAIGWLAAQLVDLWRAWRVGEPARATRGVLIGAGVWLLTAALAWATSEPGGERAVRVAGIECRGIEHFQFGGENRSAFFRSNLVLPTVQLAGPDVADPPDLVLWPEGAWFPGFQGDPPDTIRGPRLAEGVRLVVGSYWWKDPGRCSIAGLLDENGEFLDWHEKHEPVPGGERFPFLGLMPKSWADWIVSQFSLVKYAPNVRRGNPRPPLRTAAGVPFAAVTCFDNSFDDVFRRVVADGARFVVVLSNESWYRQGGELDQMVAMTVFRALESGVPVVRCTVDGVSCLVEANGEVSARLGPSDTTKPRVLDVEVTPGPVEKLPLAWIQRLIIWLVLASGVTLLLPQTRK